MKKPLISVLIGAFALTALSGCSAQPYSGPHTDCTVTGKYVAYVSKSTQKRIESSCGVFVVDDDLLNGRFDSADMYARIQVNHTYNFTAKGVRQPFFSLFPNVLQIQEVSK